MVKRTAFRFFIVVFLTSLSFISLPQPAFSLLPPPGGINPVPPPTGGGGGFTITNPIDSDNFAQIMQKIARLVVMVALPLTVVMIIWAGAQFVFARGDSKKLTDAKNTLWYAIIGALLVVGAFAIATAIENFAKKL